jgi:plasmid stabilization system protein ParE
MTYKVRLQLLAENDLDEAYLWAAKSAPETAGLWLARFQAALQTLAERPERCGLVPEHKKLKRELRQFVFGPKAKCFSRRFSD